MATGHQHGAGWTVVLPRQPVSIAKGRQEGGYTAACEIRCDCGDHPDLDYREVSLRLQRIRGPTRSRTALPHTRKASGLDPQPGAHAAGMTDLAGQR